MLLNVENLNVHYGRAQVLHEISAHVEEGELVCMVGRNGAGEDHVPENHRRFYETILRNHYTSATRGWTACLSKMWHSRESSMCSRTKGFLESSRCGKILNWRLSP